MPEAMRHQGTVVVWFALLEPLLPSSPLSSSFFPLFSLHFLIISIIIINIIFRHSIASPPSRVHSLVTSLLPSFVPPADHLATQSWPTAGACPWHWAQRGIPGLPASHHSRAFRTPQNDLVE